MGLALALFLSAAPLLVRRIWPVPVLGCVLAASLAIGIASDRHTANGLALLIALYTVATMRPRREALACAAVFELFIVAVTIWLAGSSWWYRRDLPVRAGRRRARARPVLRHPARLPGRAARPGRPAGAGTRPAGRAGGGGRARQDRPRDARHRRPPPHGHGHLERRGHRRVELRAGALRTGHRRHAPCVGHRADGARRYPPPPRRPARAPRRPLRRRSAAPPGEEAAEARQPVPDLAQLDALIEQVRSAGLDTTLEVRGEAPDVPVGVQLTVYRLVQEALTNTLKHGGPGARAAVRLHFQPGELLVDIDDDGAGVLPTSTSTSASGGTPPPAAAWSACGSERAPTAETCRPARASPAAGRSPRGCCWTRVMPRDPSPARR